MTAEESYHFSLLALCVWREAQGEPDPGKLAVAWSIRNRVEKGGWFGSGYAGVILKPYQYSSFNPPFTDKSGKLVVDPNATKFPLPETDPAFGACLLAAKHVYEGTLADPTLGATHYYAAWMKTPPDWAKTMTQTVQIGDHIFFK